MNTERKRVASEEKNTDDLIFLSFDQSQLEKTLETKLNKLRENLEQKRARNKENQRRSDQLVKDAEIEEKKQNALLDISKFKTLAYTFDYNGKLIPVKPLKLNEFKVPMMEVKLISERSEVPSSSRLSKTPGVGSNKKRISSASVSTTQRPGPTLPTQQSSNQRLDTNELRVETIESKGETKPITKSTLLGSKLEGQNSKRELLGSKFELIGSKQETQGSKQNLIASKEEAILAKNDHAQSKPLDSPELGDQMQSYRNSMKTSFKPTKGVTFKFGSGKDDVLQASWPSVDESQNSKTGQKVKKMTRVHFEKVAIHQGSKFYSNLKKKYQTGFDIEDDPTLDSNSETEEDQKIKEDRIKRKPHSSNLIRSDSRTGSMPNLGHANASEFQARRSSTREFMNAINATGSSVGRDEPINYDNLEVEKDLGQVFEEGRFVEVHDKSRGISFVLNTDKKILRSLLDRESSRTILRSARDTGNPYRGKSSSQTHNEESGSGSMIKVSSMIDPLKSSSMIYNQSIVSIHCNTRDGIRRESKERTGAIKPGVSPLRIRRTRLNCQSQF